MPRAQTRSRLPRPSPVLTVLRGRSDTLRGQDRGLGGTLCVGESLALAGHESRGACSARRRRGRAGSGGPSCQAARKPRGEAPTEKPVLNLLNEKGKQRLTETGKERESGPEPTPLRANVPKSLTFGKELGRRSQGFGTGLLPAPGSVEKKRRRRRRKMTQLK